MQRESPPIPATLARLVAAGADAARIADIALQVWCDIDAALSPVLGKRAVAALYQRSIHLTRSDYPWLESAQENALQSAPFSALRAALAQQTSAFAAAASSTLLRNFYDLLVTLVGTALCERLLHSVWTISSSGPAVQDDAQ